MHVEVLSVDRRLIDLEIARVHDRTRRRVQRNRHAVGHAVRHAQKFGFALADAHALPRLHGDEPLARIDAVLFELRAHQRERERRAVHRAIDVRPDIGHGADVIFVAVGQQQSSRPPRELLQIRQIGNHQIDARQFGSAEHHPGIDHHRRLGKRHGHEIHAELAKPAKRDDIQMGHV